MIDGGRKIFFAVTTQWPSIFYALAQPCRAFRKRYLSSIKLHTSDPNQNLPGTEYCPKKPHSLLRVLCLSTLKVVDSGEPNRRAVHHEIHSYLLTVNTLKVQQRINLLPINLMKIFAWQSLHVFRMVLCRWSFIKDTNWISFFGLEIDVRAGFERNPSRRKTEKGGNFGKGSLSVNTTELTIVWVELWERRDALGLVYGLLVGSGRTKECKACMGTLQ